MKKARKTSGMSAVTVALLLAASLILGSCAKTSEVLREPPDTLELLAGLEQTREITLEEELTYLLSRLFGIENVHVLVSSRARYGTTEEREEVTADGGEPAKVILHTGDMGEIQRVTVAVLINSDVLTPEEKEDPNRLLEKLYLLVANGAGLIMEEDDKFGDSVAILFMPFAN
jgi:flagellar biosynthesis/type III secretory pathway M-ring protein FliF/YscJ